MSVTKINSKVLAIMILWTLALLIEAPNAPTPMKGADWRHIRSQYNAIQCNKITSNVQSLLY